MAAIDPKLTRAVSTLFGPDFTISRGYIDGHDGVDIKAKLGLELRTIAGGTVSYARDARKDPRPRRHWAEGGGKVVNIDIGGNRTIQYAHLHAIAVREGQSVERGDLVGTIGQTGLATGPHVHFGLWDHDVNEMIQPLPYLSKLAGLAVTTSMPVHNGPPVVRPNARITDLERYASPRHFRIPPGTTLRGYDPAHPGRHLVQSAFPSGSGARAAARVSITWPGAEREPIPHGTFLEVFDGLFMGLYIPAGFVVLDPAPQLEMMPAG